MKQNILSNLSIVRLCPQLPLLPDRRAPIKAPASKREEKGVGGEKGRMRGRIENIIV